MICNRFILIIIVLIICSAAIQYAVGGSTTSISTYTSLPSSPMMSSLTSSPLSTSSPPPPQFQPQQTPTFQFEERGEKVRLLKDNHIDMSSTLERPAFKTIITITISPPSIINQLSFDRHQGEASVDAIFCTIHTTFESFRCENAPPDAFIQEVTYSFISSQRIPLDITIVSNGDEYVYYSPGISPITLEPMPLIGYTLDETRKVSSFDLINPNNLEAFLDFPQADRGNYLCLKSSATTPYCCDVTKSVEECQDLINKTSETVPYANFFFTTMKTTDPHSHYPLKALPTKQPAANIFWPFDPGQIILDDTAPIPNGSCIQYKAAGPGLRRHVIVKWALQPGWSDSLPASQVFFNFPSIPFYEHFATLNGCSCQSSASADLCAPGSDLIETTQIILCRFEISPFSVYFGSIFHHIDLDQSPPPFPIQLSYITTDDVPYKVDFNKNVFATGRVAVSFWRELLVKFEIPPKAVWQSPNSYFGSIQANPSGPIYVPHVFKYHITGPTIPLDIELKDQVDEKIWCTLDNNIFPTDQSDLLAVLQTSTDIVYIQTTHKGPDDIVLDCISFRMVEGDVDNTSFGSTSVKYTSTNASFDTKLYPYDYADPYKSQYGNFIIQIPSPKGNVGGGYLRYYQSFPNMLSQSGLYIPLTPIDISGTIYEDTFTVETKAIGRDVGGDETFNDIWRSTYQNYPTSMKILTSITFDNTALSIVATAIPEAVEGFVPDQGCQDSAICHFVPITGTTPSIQVPVDIPYHLSSSTGTLDYAVFSATLVHVIEGSMGSRRQSIERVKMFKPNVDHRIIFLQSSTTPNVLNNLGFGVNYPIGAGITHDINVLRGDSMKFVMCMADNDILQHMDTITFSLHSTADPAQSSHEQEKAMSLSLEGWCNGIDDYVSVTDDDIHSGRVVFFKVVFSSPQSPSITYYTSAFTLKPSPFQYQITQFAISSDDFYDVNRPNAATLKVIAPTGKINFDFNLNRIPLLIHETSSNSLKFELSLPIWVGITSASSGCQIVEPAVGTVAVQFSTSVTPREDIVEGKSKYLIALANPLANGNTFTGNLFPQIADQRLPGKIKCEFKFFIDPTVPVVDYDIINTPVELDIKVIIPTHDTREADFGSPLPQLDPVATAFTGPTDLYFVHPLSSLTPCRDVNERPISCPAVDLPITTVKEVLPPQEPKLPTTTTSLTGHCDVVYTNKHQYEEYLEDTHENMCSIPISGMLTTRPITQNDVPQLTLPTDKTEFNLCDCRCKGYWIDDVDNNDYKKCSKCAVPNCPALFTPNSECTACECSTPQCKRFTTNVFGMIYFKPQVLRYLIDITSDTTKPFISASLSDTDLSNYLHNPIQYYKTTYFNLIAKFSLYLNEHLTTAQNSSPTPSILRSVLITPLVEGSFTAWKITLNFVNGSKQPLSKMAPLYGLPAVEKKMSELFGAFIIQQFSLTQYPIDFSTHVLTSPFSSSSPSTTSQTKLPLFTSDVIKVGCINRDDHDNGVVITRDMLHDCPLPNQYVSAKNNVTKADNLNPLWSKCDTNDSISFINYESLLDTTTKSTSLRVRQLYPHCFDFAGVNVGKEYHIPCGYNPTTDLLYSTTSSSLILPSYTTALLSSFVPSPTTPDEAKKRITRLLSLQQSRFPSFPSPTIVLCPVPDPTLPPMPQTLPTSSTQRCSVDTYGDQCQYKSIISETSMTSSPTTVSPQSYAHVQWHFMGDNTQELTIVLYSTQKKNDGQGYFVWSQLLTTVPVASLYASAQVPTFDQSKLFEIVYDAIANGNNIDLVNIYSSSTKIAIKGYFTRGAQQLITLDETQIVEQFKFDLPMLCTEFNVSCSHTQSQYCTQNDGRCKCKPGYYDVYPTQERLPNYTTHSTDSTKNIDGSDLTCLPLCQNNGEWINETSTCKCQDGYNGEYCQVKDDCQVNKSSLCQGDNGYIAFTLLTDDDSEATTTTTPSCQDTKCQCYGHWINQSDAPNTDDLIKTKPKDYVTRNNGCSICSLKPINSQFYSPEQLVIINDYYSSNTELSTQYYGNEDTMYTQTYQPTTTTTTNINTNEQLHPLTRQRCYITGTQPTTYDDGNCIKCQCKRGYGGDYCQLHIAYANMTYTPTDGNDYIYDKTTEVLLFNKLTEELSLSMNNFDKTQMFVIQHNRDYHWVEIGLYTGLDFFTRNAEYNASIQQQQQHQQQQQSEGYLMSTQQTTTATFNPTLLPTNLDSLYTQWDDLTTNFPTTPVKNQDTNDYLGPIDPPAVIQDPACFEQEIIGCSGDAPKRMNSYALLIGLVVGLVGAALLFIILLLILLWCRKNERGFWKSQKEQERDEMSSFVMTPRQDFKGSTAAPSMTIGTTSIQPIKGTSVELQPMENYTKTSAIQSATNHTEIVDPSLPPNIKGYKDAKGQIFYVDSDTMTTSWDHPNEVKDKEADNGNGW